MMDSRKTYSGSPMLTDCLALMLANVSS